MGLYLNGKLVGISLPQAGGGQPINNQDITVTENGTYEAEEGYTGLGEVTVDVPSADEVTATNKTGSSISVGDKVWLNKILSVNETTNVQSTSNNRWLALISPDGNYLVVNSYSYNNTNTYVYPRLYNISDLSNISDTNALSSQGSSYLKSIQFCYNSDGDLIIPFYGETVGLKSSGGYWTSNIQIGSYRATKISHLKDNLYAINAQQNADYWGLYLCRLDHSSGSVTQSSSRYEEAAYESQTRWAVDGYFVSNKYFITSPLYNSYYCKRYEITDEANLTATYSNAGYLFYGQMLGTEDNAFIMNCNAQTNTFGVYNPTSASMPSSLSRFSGRNCWVTYNKKNKILTIAQWNSLNYGIFKYENGTFTELDYNLFTNINTSGKVLGGFITASEDLRRFAFAIGEANSELNQFGYNSTFTPYVAEFTEPGNPWNIQPFSLQNIDESTLIGYAETSGANGEEITVKTLLPRKVDVTITVDQDDAEIIAE